MSVFISYPGHSEKYVHFGQWNYLISNAPISIIFRVGDNCTLLLFHTNQLSYT